MTKLKHKQPPKNFFRYFLDEYILFRHDFTIETPASVAECARRIRKLSYERQGCWRSRRILVSFLEAVDKQHFTIRSEQPQKHGYAQSASAEGSIEQLDDGRTIVSGKVMMSGWLYWLGIAVIAFMFFLPLLIIDIDLRTNGWVALLMYFGLFGALIIFSWLQMYIDRNYLIRLIQNAIHNAERKTELIKARKARRNSPDADDVEYELQRRAEKK